MLIPDEGHAQTRRSVLFGSVIAADSAHDILPDVELLVESLEIATRTDSTGAFTLAGFPEGKFEVLFRRLGFGAQRQTVTFTGSDTVSLLVFMDRLTVELPSVDVRANEVPMRMRDFEAYRRAGIGHFLVREEIEKSWRGRTLLDVLETRRGSSRLVRTTSSAYLVSTRGLHLNGRPLMRGGLGAAPECVFMIVVDGVPTRQTDLRRFNLPADQIEAIEIYAGPSEVPARYNASGSTCGVIGIWTRVK